MKPTLHNPCKRAAGWEKVYQTALNLAFSLPECSKSSISLIRPAFPS